MAIQLMLHFLAFLVLQANLAILQRENITVLEGQSVVLNCTMNRSENESIDWTNPQRHITYFNNVQGLRDRRYKLVHYSGTKLIITLLNTTVQDDGMYTCTYYGHQPVTKQVYLTVLAPPSPPVLNITKHLLKGREEKVIRCITTGSKPKPQITWLLNNKLELHEHTEYIPENKGAKFTTISMLKIKAHDQESRVDCLVRHESLMNKVLRVSYRFDNNYNSLGLYESYTQNANETSTTSMPESTSNSESFESITQENNTENIPTVNYTTTTFIPESTADTEQPEPDKVENSTQDTPKTNYDFVTSREDSTLLTSESETESSLNSISSTDIPTTETGQSAFQITEDSSTSHKSNPQNLTEDTTESYVTETESSLSPTPSMELPITEIQQNTSQNKADSFTSSYSNPHNSTENTGTNEETINSTTVWGVTNNSSLEQENPISTAKCEDNQTMKNHEKPQKLQMKQSSALLLILVAFLICALLIVFQMFVLKIRKEHLKWRKQKDDSDLTVESNRSNRSSNEENVRPENNNRDPNFGTPYTIHIHSEEQMKQYTNFTEDQINTLDKESTV
ncbi:cytotoxic and regulatory T-cell molecule isoform X2 [Carcharodon carcharias]|uniref:cytotoxic and regulatory T-cell molecule isoform X2 n=1 Tax=Carcharodon carcharias TaxID=13397 RepID=UPI001B7E000B|nr:cytotoxic and regulatory T-cell molecule isoform X2 [Carcharodon carcharias]